MLEVSIAALRQVLDSEGLVHGAEVVLSERAT